MPNLAERFPKTMQERESLSINSTDTSISRSKQLEASGPASTISSLSSGEFVGITADNPDQTIELKAFHCKIINDAKKLAKEKASFKSLPDSGIDKGLILENYRRIKQDVQEIASELLREY